MAKQSAEFVELLKHERELKNVRNGVAVKNNELNEILGKIEEQTNYLNSLKKDIKQADTSREKSRLLHLRESRHLRDTLGELQDWKPVLESMKNEERYRDVLNAIAARIEGMIEEKQSFLRKYRNALIIALKSVPDREFLIQNAEKRMVDLSPEEAKYTQASLQLDHEVEIQLKKILARKGVFEFRHNFAEFADPE